MGCVIIADMKLPRRLDKALAVMATVAVVLVFGCVLKMAAVNTFANSEEQTFATEGAKFVTFYDGGEKLIVKTDAATVREALERAEITVGTGDIVEPGLDSEINAENFFINIYRARPVIVQDGAMDKYLMTASYDYKTIAREAGVTVYDGDEVTMVPNDNFLENGVANVYKVTRNGGRTLTVEEEIPFAEETVKALSELSGLCPHFHLSLQSGCDETLKRMNRHYTAGEYYNSVEILRKYFNRAAITTDVIVGFPQETEEEFLETCAFLDKVQFFEMHIFKYSKRKGTVAAGMPGQVPDSVKTERSSRLLDMEAEQSKAFRSFYIGREAEVLFEESKTIKGRVYQLGHTRDYVKVALETEENLANQIRTVKVDAFLNNEILNALKFSDK